jgi:uncharacterized membrane protein YtjA (UPF0391 family)
LRGSHALTAWRAARRWLLAGEIRCRPGDLPSEAALARAMLLLQRRGTRRISRRGLVMLHYAVVFFLIAIVAAVFGFGGIAIGAAEIAKVLFFVFLVLFVGSLIWGLLNKRNL